MTTRYGAAMIAALGVFVSILGAAGESAEPGLLAKVWTVVPKNGSEDKFAKAFAEHVQWRRDNKDPWAWDVFVQVDGAEPGARYARSWGHHWADFDAYDASEFGQKAGQHWNATVAPHVGSIRAVITEFMPELSHWPEDAPDYVLFQLNTQRIKPGHRQRFEQAVGALADTIKEAGWPHHWAFIEHHSGSLPAVMLVIPSMDWAGMAEPDPNVFDVVAKVHGEEKAAAMFEAYNATVESTETVFVRRLPQLAVPAAE